MKYLKEYFHGQDQASKNNQQEDTYESEPLESVDDVIDFLSDFGLNDIDHIDDFDNLNDYLDHLVEQEIDIIKGDLHDARLDYLEKMIDMHDLTLHIEDHFLRNHILQIGEYVFSYNGNQTLEDVAGEMDNDDRILDAGLSVEYF